MVILEIDQEQNIISVWYFCDIMLVSGYLNKTKLFNYWLTDLVNKTFFIQN